MRRRVGLLSLALAVVAALSASLVTRLGLLPGTVFETPVSLLAARALSILAITFAGYGLYVVVSRFLVARTADRRREGDVRNVVGLLFGTVALAGVLGVLTEQWVGLLFSLGIVGFAVTFALQQPLFSLVAWVYIVLKRPYRVGDRVTIEGSRGDVVEGDFFVTTLWEAGGDLVSTNQPSGRIITLPNSVVLSSHVFNHSWEAFPYVWNELSIQVAYETDLDFAREAMVEVADDYLGDDMVARIADYRENLEETPIELEVRDRPTVNVIQQESWVELKLRYLVHPKRGQRVRNDLYEGILARFNAEPDRVKFPLGRNR